MVYFKRAEFLAQDGIRTIAEAQEMKLVPIEERLQMMDLRRPFPFRFDPVDGLGAAQPVPLRIELSYEAASPLRELFGSEDPKTPLRIDLE